MTRFIQNWVLLSLVIWLWCSDANASLAQTEAVTTVGEEAQQTLSDGFRRSVDVILPAVVTLEVQRGPRMLTTQASENEPFSVADQTPTVFEAAPFKEKVPDIGDGTGSGIIFDKRGYVLTCHHVVEDGDRIFVRLEDGRRFEAISFASDPVSDLAVVQVRSNEPLPTVTIGNSDKVELGDWVASIGNPYGLGVSVSAGVISATDRHLSSAPRTHFLQTDASSNPGNSGGALVNVKGEVIGISEGGYGSHAGFQGIGFAIPINEAMGIARQLLENGSVTHVRLDFDAEPLDPRAADILGVDPATGLLICAVVPGSPAAKAGIKIGDVVTTIAGVPVRKGCDVARAIEQAVSGQPLSVSIVRDSKSISLEYIPQALEKGDITPEHHDLRRKASPSTDLIFGLGVSELSTDKLKQLGFTEDIEGVAIASVSPMSEAAKEGVLAGMIIVRVGSRPVKNSEEYYAAVNEYSGPKGLLMLVATPHDQHFVILQK